MPKLLRSWPDVAGFMLSWLRSNASGGVSDVNHGVTAAATSAKDAKSQTLPVLQANQDVFSQGLKSGVPTITNHHIYA